MASALAWASVVLFCNCSNCLLSLQVPLATSSQRWLLTYISETVHCPHSSQSVYMTLSLLSPIIHV